MAGIGSSRDVPMKRRWPGPTVLVLVGVLLVHGAGLWALQSGLLIRTVEAVIAVDVISGLIDLPKPKRELPAPLAPQKIKTAAPVIPHVAAPAVQPVAIANAMPSPAVPAGATTPQAAAAPIALPVTASPAPLPAPAPALTPKVELPSSDAQYLHNPKPEYPRLSRQRAEQGRVLVHVYIGTDGVAQKAEIKSSSGFDRLDQAALATATAWRYVPGKRGGVPEAMWFTVPINFVLE
jgi:periplasmic protein TonB